MKKLSFITLYITTALLIIFPVEKDFSWAKGAVGYEIFPNAFYDSDNNGFGDINGIIEKLDYLNDGKPGGNDLGIDFIWLTPVTLSKSAHGYDVIDYFDISKRFGTMDDFEKLLEEAHKRGIKIIFDLVLNHCSAKHEYFQEALKDKNSDKRNWFIFKDTQPTWFTWQDMMFQDANDGTYYWGTFGMPDWNASNPETKDYLFSTAKFWLDKGVDGFRLDAIRHLIEVEKQDGSVQTINTDETLKWLKSFSDYVYSVNPQALIIGEIWDKIEISSLYSNPDIGGLSSAFNFYLNDSLNNSIKYGASSYANALKKSSETVSKEAIDVIFSSNHDRPRVYDTLDKDISKLKLFAKVLILTPGTPMIYYGDEIGMGHPKYLSGDNRYRTPMIWNTTEEFYGFTKRKNFMPGFSVNAKDTGVYNELKNKNSLLNVYKKMIQLRKNLPGYDKCNFAFHKSTKDVLYFFAVSDSNKYLVTINYNKKKQTVTPDKESFVNTFGDNSFELTQVYPEQKKQTEIILDDTSYDKGIDSLSKYQVKIYSISF